MPNLIRSSSAPTGRVVPRLRPTLVAQFLPSQAAECRGLAQHLELLECLSRPRPIDFARGNAPPDGIVVERMDRPLVIWYADRHPPHSLYFADPPQGGVRADRS